MWPFDKKQQQITVDINIDYEKLAQEIVKAQEIAKKAKRRTGKRRGAVMAFLNGVLYLLITVFCGGLIITMWKEFANSPKHSLVIYIGCTIIFVFIGIYAFLCQQESLGDSDEEARQHFNTNVSLIALIIALIALVVEVI